MTISYASIQMVEITSEKSDKVKIITRAQVKDSGTEEHCGVGKQGAR